MLEWFHSKFTQMPLGMCDFPQACTYILNIYQTLTSDYQASLQPYGNYEVKITFYGPNWFITSRQENENVWNKTILNVAVHFHENSSNAFFILTTHFFHIFPNKQCFF